MRLKWFRPQRVKYSIYFFRCENVNSFPSISLIKICYGLINAKIFKIILIYLFKEMSLKVKLVFHLIFTKVKEFFSYIKTQAKRSRRLCS